MRVRVDSPLNEGRPSNSEKKNCFEGKVKGQSHCNLGKHHHLTFVPYLKL